MRTLPVPPDKKTKDQRLRRSTINESRLLDRFSEADLRQWLLAAANIEDYHKLKNWGQSNNSDIPVLFATLTPIIFVAYVPGSVVCLQLDKEMQWHIQWMLRPDMV